MSALAFAAVVALAALVSGATLNASDPCLSSSYAPTAVQLVAAAASPQMFASSPANAVQLQTLANFLAVAQPGQSAFFTSVFAVFPADGTFATLVDCRTSATYMLAGCSLENAFTFLGAGQQAFESDTLHELETGSSVTGPASDFSSTAFAQTLVAALGTDQSGWVGVAPSFLGSGVNQTYVLRMGTAIIGATRAAFEPCSPCLWQAVNSTNSSLFARALTYNSFSGFSTPVTANSSLALLLSSTILFADRLAPFFGFNITIPTFYWAYPDKSSYLIKDCMRWTSDCPSGTSTRFVATVTNPAIFGNLLRYTFELHFNSTTSGPSSEISEVLGRLVAVSAAPFDGTTRAWYRGVVGWTGSYGAFETLSSIRSYSWPVGISEENESPEVVVAVSWYLVEAPQCTFSAATVACHDASYAPTAAHVAAMVGETSPPLYTSLSVNVACTRLLSAVMPLNNGFFLNVYYARSNDESVMIKYCNTPASATIPACNGRQYLCYVSSREAFGDNLRRIFGFVPAGPGSSRLVLDAMPTVVPIGELAPLQVAGTYLPTMRPWYLQLNMPGWSNTTYALASGGMGESYSAPFAYGVAGADRFSAEPCSSCVINALNTSTTFERSALPIVANVMSTFGSVNTPEGIVNASFALFSTVYGLTMSPELGSLAPSMMLPDMYVGFPNSNSYFLTDCRRWTSVCHGFNVTYGVWVRNSYFGDGRRRFLPVINNMVVFTVYDITSTEFSTTTRSWYTNLRGWAAPSISASAGLEIRSFSTPMPNNTGVAAFSFFSAQAPQCNFSAAVTTCHSVSYAVPAATAAANLGAMYDVATSQEAVYKICSALYNSTVGLNNNFYRNVYFGLSNSDFYMIKYCNVSGAYNLPGCDRAVYTCWVRNTRLFATNQRYVFLMSSTGSVVPSTGPIGSYAAIAGAYTTTGRPWYVQINLPGWSNSTYAFSSGGSGDSYSVPFPGGVAAADRFESEPCSTCIMQALNAAQTTGGLSNLAMAVATYASTLTNATTPSAVAAIVKGLFDVVVSNTLPGQLLPDTYFGQSNEDVYMIVDCRRWTTPCPKNTTYAAWLRNAAVYTSTLRLQFALDNSGNIVGGIQANSTVPYTPLTRPWYLTGLGWSPEFLSAVDGYAMRSFAAPLAGGRGVAAVSFFDVAAPQCTFSPQVSACHAASYAPAAASTAAAVAMSLQTRDIRSSTLVEATCNALIAAFLPLDQGFFVNAYFALSNGDFYMIKSCRTAGAMNTPGCMNFNYTCWVRNQAVFGTTQRWIFAMTSSDGVKYTVSPTGTLAFGTLANTGPYATTARPWYIQINQPGWSNSSYALASGGTGESYSVPFSGGVAAADRWGLEPCSACLLSALAGSNFPSLMANVGLKTLPTPAGFEQALSNGNYYAAPYNLLPPLVTNYTTPDDYMGLSIVSCALNPALCAGLTSYSFVTSLAFAQSPILFQSDEWHMLNVFNGLPFEGNTLEEELVPMIPQTRGWMPVSAPQVSGWYYVETMAGGAIGEYYSVALFLNSSFLMAACDPAVCGNGNVYNPANFACQQMSVPCGPGTKLDLVSNQCVVSSNVCGANTQFEASTMTCESSVTFFETVLTSTGVCVPTCSPIPAPPKARRAAPIPACTTCGVATTTTTTMATTPATTETTSTTTTSTAAAPTTRTDSTRGDVTSAPTTAAGTTTRITTARADTTAAATTARADSTAAAAATTTAARTTARADTTTTGAATTPMASTTAARTLVEATVGISGLPLSVFNNNRDSFVNAVIALSPRTITGVQVLSASDSRRRSEGLQVQYAATVLTSQLSTTISTLNTAASTGVLANSLRAMQPFTAYNVTTSVIVGARAATGSGTSSSSGLSNGAIASIVIGCILAVGLAVSVGMLLQRRNTPSRKVADANSLGERMVNLQTNPTFDPYSTHHTESNS